MMQMNEVACEWAAIAVESGWVLGFTLVAIVVMIVTLVKIGIEEWGKR